MEMLLPGHVDPSDPHIYTNNPRQPEPLVSERQRSMSIYKIPFIYGLLPYFRQIFIIVTLHFRICMRLM